jgi:putative oxidoreductase
MIARTAAPREAPVFEAFCKEKLAPLVLRVALGLVCVYHGYLKIMAAGGTAWSPGLATGWQLLIAWGEFGAGLAILVGLHCRVAAAVVVLLTTGTLIWWQGWNLVRLPLASLEPAFLLLLLGLALLFLGAGELSLDGRAGGKGAGAKLAKHRA